MRYVLSTFKTGLLVTVSAMLLNTGCTTAGMKAARGERDFGLLGDTWTDAAGNRHSRVLGPFYEHIDFADGRRMTAFRPFVSKFSNAEGDRTSREYLWPVASSKKYKDERSWRVLNTYYQDFDIYDDHSRYRLWSLPLYFQGRDATGTSYVALFPLGGRIHEIFGRDRVSFTLFPLKSSSRINEMKTRTWLWPVYSITEGDDTKKFRLFPFYGVHEKKDQFRKKFVLWPFYTSARYTGEKIHGSGTVLFPLWGHTRLTDQETWMLLPPFIRYTKGEKMDMLHAPWPFIQMISGDMEKRYIWPLWGQKKIEGVHSSFFLWPLVWSRHTDRGDRSVVEHKVLPFWHYAGSRADAGGEQLDRYMKVWPLFSFEKRDGVARTRLLELWPLRYTGPIERNYAPFWTFFTHRKTATQSELEILWGLIRHEKEEDRSYFSFFPFYNRACSGGVNEVKKWSLLKGLLSRKKEPGMTTWRWLYFFTVNDRNADSL